MKPLVQETRQFSTASLEECYSPDFASHGMGEEFTDSDGLRKMARTYLTAFPDMQMTIEAQVELGEMVVMRILAAGSNSGEFDGKTPAGKAVRVSLISMARFVDGTVAEEWEEGYLLGIMARMGHLSAGFG